MAKKPHENRLTDVFPNTCIALRILLTVPVTVASGERSFSKLKLIKTYLHSTMMLDYSSLNDNFASAKARKVDLYYSMTYYNEL